MALQIWIPFISDNHNQGLTSNQVTAGTCTYTTGGTLGNAATFNGSSTYQRINYHYTKQITFAIFAKFNNFSIHLVDARDASGNGYQPMYVGQSGVQAGGGSSFPTIDYQFTAGVWYHLCVVETGTKVQLYVNGNFVNEAAHTGIEGDAYLSVGTRYSGANWFNGQVNDLRVYDHALSPKEVKEISKGLVQHLKLDDMRIGTVTNMLTAGGTYSTTTGSTWTGHYYVGTVEDAVGPVPFARMNKLEITVSGTTTGGGASLARQTNIVVQPSTQYTYSTYVKASDNLQYGHANFLYRYEYDSAGTKTIEQGVYTTAKREDIGDGWYRIWNTFTTQATTAKMHVYFYTYPGKTMTYYLGGCQLEKGSILHPYTEGTQTNSSVIDCSGYLNNGTIYGSPSLYASAPKYECSTYIGTNNAIVAGRGGMVRPSITVAIWAYMDSWSSYSARLASCTEGGGWNFEPSSSKMNFAMGTGASSNTYKSATSNRTLASLGSGWHHFVGTYDGFTTKIYIDGVLEGSNAAYTTHTPIFYVNNAVFLGAEAAASQTVPTGSYFPGALSDFRIYGTALSAEDVAELYHTAASVDNYGNFFCGEIKEV